MSKHHLLSSREVAQFVASGFLQFNAIVPEELNRRMIVAINEGAPTCRSGVPLNNAFPQDTPVADFVGLPRLQGVIHSLLGAEPIFERCVIHIREPFEGQAQHLHCDGVVNPLIGFKLKLLYFPHEVTPDMGGTLLVPGSQYRRTSGSEIARYQNFLGQVTVVCPGGTIVVAHDNIWHAGRRNNTAQRRLMLKLRLSASEIQPLQWDVGDLDHPDIQTILRQRFPWYEYACGQMEFGNRQLLWLKLTGKDKTDTE